MVKQKRGERETKGEWFTNGVHIQSVLYLSIITTQRKTIQKRVKHLLMKVKAYRHAGA